MSKIYKVTTEVVTCTCCGGRGSRDDEMGHFTCGECRGLGRIITKRRKPIDDNDENNSTAEQFSSHD